MDIKNRDDYAVTAQPYTLGGVSQTSLDKYIAQFKKFVKEFIKNKILYSKKSGSETTSYSERYGSEMQTEEQVERAQVRDAERAKIRSDEVSGENAESVQETDQKIGDALKMKPLRRRGLTSKE